MSITGFLRAYWHRAVRKYISRRLRNSPAHFSIKRHNWDYSLRHPTEFYFECVRYYQQALRPELKEHRNYFQQEHRGFGEDAFHVMWEMLVQEFKPTNFLEIGVFRGQVISLITLCARLEKLQCEIWGISPFSGEGDSISKYRRDLDYYEDTLRNFDHFALPHPHLLRASSVDPEAIRLVNSRQWDMIYIDGNHDYEFVRQDWENCSRQLKRGGIIVLDDSNATPAYQPGSFATRGMDGPTRLASEIKGPEFREILQVGHNRVFQRAS